MAAKTPASNGSHESFEDVSSPASRDSRSTTVSVDDSETWVEAKRYTVYKVVVRLQDKAYFLFRR